MNDFDNKIEILKNEYKRGTGLMNYVAADKKAILFDMLWKCVPMVKILGSKVLPEFRKPLGIINGICVGGNDLIIEEAGVYWNVDSYTVIKEETDLGFLNDGQIEQYMDSIDSIVSKAIAGHKKRNEKIEGKLVKLDALLTVIKNIDVF